MKSLLSNISRKQAFIYAVFLVAYEFLTYIANDMIMPAMIRVVAEFNAPETAIASSLTAYVLGGASLQIILGPISDSYGRRPVMLFGAFSFLVFTIAIACSNSIEQFLLLRFFQGMGLCYIAVIGYSTLQEIFSEMDAIRLISLMANIAIFAPLIGPVLGAIFIYYYSWRYIFIIIAVLTAIAFIGLWLVMPEPIGQKTIEGNIIKKIRLSPKAIYKNYRKLFYNSTFILGSIALGVIYLPCLAWIGLSPVLLVEKSGLSIIQYALWQIPVFTVYILGNIYLRQMTHRGTIEKMITIGSIIGVISLIFCYLIPVIFNFNYLWLMPGIIGYFFAIGIVPPPLTRLILYSTRVTKGTAAALMSMIAMVIQALGVELANFIYKTHHNDYIALYCAIAGALYTVILIWCFFSYKQRSHLLNY